MSGNFSPETSMQSRQFCNFSSQPNHFNCFWLTSCTGFLPKYFSGWFQLTPITLEISATNLSRLIEPLTLHGCHLLPGCKEVPPCPLPFPTPRPPQPDRPPQMTEGTTVASFPKPPPTCLPKYCLHTGVYYGDFPVSSPPSLSSGSKDENLFPLPCTPRTQHTTCQWSITVSNSTS